MGAWGWNLGVDESQSSHLEQRESGLGQPDQCAWGLENADNFPERCLCWNLRDTSIHLPLVVPPKGLGLTWALGHSRRDVTSGWWGAACTVLPTCQRLCAQAASSVRLPLGGVRTQGECKSHSLQFPHPQPGTIFT